jgi:hypothetical protein
MPRNSRPPAVVTAPVQQVRHRIPDWRAVAYPRGEWDQLRDAYGIGSAEPPGLALLRRMRELRALTPYIRNAGDPAFGTELNRRVAA